MRAGPDDERKTRVIYVTARLPYGVGEPFIVTEIAALERRGCDVAVVPVLPKGAIVHGDALDLVSKASSVSLVSGGVLRAAVAETARAPAAVARAVLSLRASRSPRILLKNLAVVPKSLWLARQARRLDVDHLHAHWAGTSATVAMLAGELAGIPWSLTAHRWDIPEDNLLRLKASRACFVRAISEHGADELRGLVGDAAWSPWVLHMGVPLPPAPESHVAPAPPLRVLAAAKLVEKKGHVHLIDAVRRLKERGVPVRVDLAGDGPLGPSLRSRVAALDLGDEIVFLGSVPHDELVRGMTDGRWHAAVLPSVVTPSGELEGIPVSLIEALACGLPAVGTEAGGTPELLGGGAGILVPPADPEAIAEALARLAEDPALRAKLAEEGRKRVEQEFSADRVAAALHERFRACGGDGSGS